MECNTIKSFDSKNKPIFIWKIKHTTLEEAQKEADRLNKKKDILIRKIPYTCSKCGFFHVGTSLEMLEGKEQKRGWFNKLPRLVDKIDLTQFDKKPKPRDYSDKARGLGQFKLPNIGVFKYTTEEDCVVITFPDENIKYVSLSNVLDVNRTVLTTNQVKKYIKKELWKVKLTKQCME